MFTVSVPAACYPGERWRAGVAQLDLQEGILSVLKGYFKPSSLSLALITGPEPARGGRMFWEYFQRPAKRFQPWHAAK